MTFFKQRREELKLRQRDIARALDMTESAVGSWERGEAVPRLKLAPRLAPLYKVSVERIEAEIVKQARALQASRQPVAAKA
jgi:transcriptional regulator with XRE-family HTH domain